jgi:flagellar hook protein FlgE
MGLASALSTALTGLTAAETQIDVVGNNLANSQTVGFKESNLAFTTQFLQTLGLGSAPTDNGGGTNPRQTGLGTQVAEIAPEFTQGTIQTSSSPSDVALQGQGFFIVESSTGEPLYTRTGIFKTNSQNELVTINGNRLMGYTVDEEFQLQTNQLVALTVPVGSLRVAQATSNVFLEGTLPPTGDVADTAEVIDSAILGDGNFPRPSAAAQASIAPTPSIIGVTPTASAAGGTLAAGTYQYRFVYVDIEGGEATPSPEVSVTVNPGQNRVNFGPPSGGILPPAPGDPNYDRLRIYRANGGGNYQMLDTVAASTTSYVDDGSRAVTTALDTTVLNASYNYLVTFRQSTGGVETRPSPLSTSVNVVNGRVYLSDIPQPDDPADYDKIRIYRNSGSDSDSYYLVEEIDAGTEVFTDSMSDVTLETQSALDMDGPKITGNTLLVNVVKRDELNYNQIFAEGVLEFTARKGGRQLETQTFTVDSSSTVQNLIDFIEDSVGIQSAEDDQDMPSSENNIVGEAGDLNPGGSVTGDGRIRFISNNGEGNAVTIGLSAFINTESDGTVSTPNVGFTSTQSAVGTSAVADFIVYDSLGIPLNVRITAVLETRNDTATTYRWFADSSDNDPATGIDLSVGTGTVTFDGQGNFISASNTNVAVDRRNVASASPLSFELHFDSISGLSSNTASLSASRQDGSESGTLSSFTIGEDGVLRGAFSNGVARTLGQIRLVRFSNPAGLEQRGQNLFATGANSGLPVEGDPGENGIASLVAGAVELSNTDIGGNLIQLVLATTQYRGNTRVITAAQQLLEELLNLRR